MRYLNVLNMDSGRWSKQIHCIPREITVCKRTMAIHHSFQEMHGHFCVFEEKTFGWLHVFHNILCKIIHPPFWKQSCRSPWTHKKHWTTGGMDYWCMVSFLKGSLRLSHTLRLHVVNLHISLCCEMFTLLFLADDSCCRYWILRHGAGPHTCWRTCWLWLTSLEYNW